MIYPTRDHAISARFYLNNVYGYPPAYIYRTPDGRYTVIRTWNMKREICGNVLDD